MTVRSCDQVTLLPKTAIGVYDPFCITDFLSRCFYGIETNLLPFAKFCLNKLFDNFPNMNGKIWEGLLLKLSHCLLASLENLDVKLILLVVIPLRTNDAEVKEEL